VLTKRGYLTEMTLEQERALFVRLATKLQRRAQSSKPSFVMMPTYQCNLRCSYCYQSHLRDDPAKRHLLRTMQPEMVDRIFVAMAELEVMHGASPGPTSKRDIGLYGGEPLLSRNRSIIAYIIDTAQRQGEASFRGVTNGADLHAYRDLLGPGKIEQLQITLDGPPAEHDTRRVYANGAGSFERIAHNVTMALEQDVRISVRTNVDASNLEHLPALAQEIARRGWNAYNHFSAYVAPVDSPEVREDVRDTLSTVELDTAMSRLRMEHPSMVSLTRSDMRLKDNVRGVLETGGDPLAGFRASFCGAEGGMYIFDPFGDIYACWERTGEPSLRMGHVNEDGTVSLEQCRLDAWQGRHVGAMDACSVCPYGLYHGGGCAARAEADHSDPQSHHCEGFPSRFQTMVAEAYLEWEQASVAVAEPALAAVTA
jgi:uncharacterized protein